LDTQENSFNLKAEIKNLGMTQKDFAKHIDRNIQTITRWVQGQVEIPKIVILYIEAYKRSKLLESILFEIKNIQKA